MYICICIYMYIYIYICICIYIYMYNKVIAVKLPLYIAHEQLN